MRYHPIFAAIEDDEDGKVAIMMAADPNVCHQRNGNKETPLLVAAYKDNWHVCKKLLEAKADPNKKDWGRRTPLHWAAINGSSRAAQVLLDAKADTTVLNCEGLSPLACALEEKNEEMCRLLIKGGAKFVVRFTNAADACNGRLGDIPWWFKEAYSAANPDEFLVKLWNSPH